MTSKPDSVSTLGYHRTDRTERPLEPQLHWDATGTTLADASTQWCSSGDPVLICIIGTHWKTTGATSTLGCHWNHTGWCLHPVVSQWQSSVHLHNWNTLEDHWKSTGRPLEDHWKHTGISPVAFQCTLGSKFQAHWIATGLPLEDHWLRVRGTNLCTFILRTSLNIFLTTNSIQGRSIKAVARLPEKNNNGSFHWASQGWNVIHKYMSIYICIWIQCRFMYFLFLRISHQYPPRLPHWHRENLIFLLCL